MILRFFPYSNPSEYKASNSDKTNNVGATFLNSFTKILLGQATVLAKSYYIVSLLFIKVKNLIFVKFYKIKIYLKY